MINLLIIETKPVLYLTAHAGMRAARETTAIRTVLRRFQLRSNGLTLRIVSDQRGAMTSRDGDLGIELFDDRCIQNPYALYERMLAMGPVHRIGDSGFYAVCSWDAINDAIARPEDFSSNLTATMMYQPDRTVAVFEMEN